TFGLVMAVSDGDRFSDAPESLHGSCCLLVSLRKSSSGRLHLHFFCLCSSSATSQSARFLQQFPSFSDGPVLGRLDFRLCPAEHISRFGDRQLLQISHDKYSPLIVCTCIK